MAKGQLDGGLKIWMGDHKCGSLPSQNWTGPHIPPEIIDLMNHLPLLQKSYFVDVSLPPPQKTVNTGKGQGFKKFTPVRIKTGILATKKGRRTAQRQQYGQIALYNIADTNCRVSISYPDMDMQSLRDELAAYMLQFLHDPLIPRPFAELLLCRLGKGMESCRVQEALFPFCDIFYNLY